MVARWLCLALLAGCGGETALPSVPGDGGPPAGDASPPLGGATYRYVVNKLSVPQQRVEFALDLNGDGRPDDQFGNIVAALAAQNFDVQGAVDQSVARGDAVHLIALQTDDASLANDDSVGFGFLVGLPRPNPDFGGAGAFAVDGALPAAQLNGKLGGGSFASDDPRPAPPPRDLTVKLALAAGATPVALTLHGAIVTCKTGVDAQSGAPGLLTGQIHGSLKQRQVQTDVIPAIAAALTEAIAAAPGSPQAQQIKALFDTGGCGGAKANDGLIDACEVATNMVIQNVLAPDVDLYDANGAWAPNPKNADKDSLSIGLGFTAVRATF